MENATETDDVKQYRSIWISDVHLGTRNCQADFLLDFFRFNDSEFLYLVGDIIDGWQLKNAWYWEQSHNNVIQKILRKARKGTRVVYIPGNHDEFLRSYAELKFGGITLISQTVHHTADGRSFLVLHGDQFDSVVQNAKWLAHLGTMPTSSLSGSIATSTPSEASSATSTGRSPPSSSTR